MERDELLRALRATAADQHRCFGCGYEHKCSIHGCAINRAAAELIERLAAENEALKAAAGCAAANVSNLDTFAGGGTM